MPEVGSVPDIAESETLSNSEEYAFMNITLMEVTSLASIAPGLRHFDIMLSFLPVAIEKQSSMFVILLLKDLEMGVESRLPCSDLGFNDVLAMDKSKQSCQ